MNEEKHLKDTQDKSSNQSKSEPTKHDIFMLDENCISSDRLPVSDSQDDDDYREPHTENSIRTL